MNKILNIYKPIGLTPYQTIQKVRETLPEYKDETIGFAGRLDPLAHGVLLLMVGEATKEREKYLNLPKEYEFEALFGLETDTYDVLGILQNTMLDKNDLQQQIEAFITSKLGKQTQPYPPFSSKTVQGKPLFLWAKNDKLSEIMIPTREIEIYDFSLLSQGEITTQELKKNIETHIKAVSGEFRQEETLKKWNTFFTKNPNHSFSTAKFRISCSSGTYVRGLVHELGKELKTGGVTLEILRTKVGEYYLKSAIRV